MDGWMVGWMVGCARDGLGSHCSFGLASSSSTLLFPQPVCRQIFRVGLALVWPTTSEPLIDFVWQHIAIYTKFNGITSAAF